ncbi:AbrB family transcriptional regulator [Azotosporobacter soli]|uniref:AbrB family transcriptional regulator n=1 Tax=Azotosporobacter soli TaxID=3055040 RepID=UPI0031FE92E9
MRLVILETGVLALLGGSLFACSAMPLPWMLGAVTALLLWNTTTRRKVRWPVSFCYAGMLVIGYSVGRTFTPSTLANVAANLGAMLAATVGVILFSLLLGWFTHRHTGISLATGLIGTLPGGLSQVTILCREIKETDLTVVLFMQTFRLLAVIFVVPFVAIKGLGGTAAAVAILPGSQITLSLPQVVLLAALIALGGFIARFLRLPTPFLLGPILMAAGIVLSGFPVPPAPKPWLNAAQLSVGAYTGARVQLADLKNWRKLLPHTILNVVALMLLCLGFGWFLERWGGLDIATAFLSMAPGGMAEMSLTAMTIGADLSAIVAFQLFRLLFLLLIATPLLKMWLLRVQQKRL